MMWRGKRLPFVLMAAVALTAAPARGPAQAPPADDALLALVPEDTAVCLVVNDLRGHARKISEAPWFKALNELAWAQALRGAPELAPLSKFEKDLEAHLGTSWARVRDDILGDRVVFAFTPGGPGRAEQERGLLLLRARDGKALAALIDRLNKLQKASGEVVRVEPREHLGARYVRRVEKRGGHFYYLRDGLVAFSETEELIRTVIARDVKGGGDGPAPVAQHLRRAGAERALAALWLNPRAFDEELRQKATEARGPEGRGLEVFRAFWKATDAVVLSCTVGDDLTLALTVQARAEQLPPRLQHLFAPPRKPSELWTRFPDKALLSVAGRLDAVELSESLKGLAPPPTAKGGPGFLPGALSAFLGLDFEREVLPNLGPDWGFCVLAPTDKAHAPYALAALAVRPGEGKAAVDQALLSALHNLAWLGLFEYNRTHPDQIIQIQRLMQDGVEVRHLAQDKLFPPGFRPAFALKEGYLVVATSPEAIARFRKDNAPLPAGEVPVLRLSLAELARLLDERRELAVAFVSEQNQVSPPLATQLVEGAVASLRLFEGLRLTHRAEQGQLTWTLRLSPADSGRP